MEIIFKSNENKSNFDYEHELTNGKKVINGFNKLNESLFERIDDSDFNCGNIIFEEPLESDLIIDYPLSVVIKQHIKVNDLHELITNIRNTYKEIYNNPRKYGIWGHSIGELSLSSIRILEGNLIEIGIDS